MANRDYFTRPNQGGGRDGPDYGHNRIDRPEPDPWTPWVAFGALFIFLYFAWQFTR